MSISRNRLAHYHGFQSNWITFSETVKHGGCPQGEAGRGGWYKANPKTQARTYQGIKNYHEVAP